MDEIAEIYPDYLIASFGLTTVTGLSNSLDGEISHDKITRFLSSKIKTGKDLRQFVKPIVREIETVSQSAAFSFSNSQTIKPASPLCLR